MNQPVFKLTTYTPPAQSHHPFPPHPPHIAPTFTPHHPNHQLLTYPANPNVPRPPNFLNARPPTAHSFIFPTHAPPPDPNRTLKLESFGRKASFQEQNVRGQNASINAIRQQLGIEPQQGRLSTPTSSPPPPHMRKPLYASQLFAPCDSLPEPPPRKSETSDLRGSFPLFASEITQMQENLNNLKLKFKNGELPNRQSKTDRDQPAHPAPNATVPLGPNLKFRQTTNAQPQRPLFFKAENVSMDSTQNSSKNLSANADAKSPQTYLSAIKKTSTPPNFWPLSISPSEEKRQNFLSADPMSAPATESSDRAEEMVEFRKRKYSELANRKKSVYEYPRKTFSLEDFQLLDKIGKGSFGDVYIAQERASGFVCVLKKLLKKKLVEMKLQEHLVREIKIQSFLKHRHLTSLYGFFDDDSFIYLILEIMPDGSLMQVKKKRKVPESEVSSYVRQICEGLKYMHTEEIIHRDIKPENIFLNDGYAKIGDFGCSIFTHSLRNTVVGSLAYISPEQLKQGFYNEKIDVWSLGVMTYEMLLGKSPYQDDIIKIARQEMAPQLSELKFPNEADLSSEARDFIIQTLHIDASQRIGIVEALKHQFIRKHEKKEEKNNEKQSL